MDEKKIARINELYHKMKSQGLTEDEKKEQARLRREYVDAVKGNLRNQLDHVTVLNPDGSKMVLKKKKNQH